MMEIQYRLATHNDVDLLMAQRLKFVEILESDEMYKSLKENCYKYFEKAFIDSTCDVILAEDNEQCIGTGIVFYYASVPSVFNPAGENAYITSMYVEPDYRCRGIGTKILNGLVEKIRERGLKVIMLNASDMGKMMYEKIGFVESAGGMILKLD